MLRFKIKQMVQAKGILHPHQFLMKNCGFTSNKAFNLLNETQKSITLSDASTLCEQLTCTPNDLLFWEQNASDKLPDDHPCLSQLSAPDAQSDWKKILKSLSKEDVDDLYKQAQSRLNKR